MRGQHAHSAVMKVAPEVTALYLLSRLESRVGMRPTASHRGQVLDSQEKSVTVPRSRTGQDTISPCDDKAAGRTSGRCCPWLSAIAAATDPSVHRHMADSQN